MGVLGKRSSFILMVGDEGTMLAPADGGAALFAARHDENARKKILGILEQNPRTPVTILANSAAQEFRIEALPPLNFFDRMKLIRRRLEQAFPQAYATASLRLSRNNVLLAGLQQGSAVAGWLTAAQRAKVRLGLLPVEASGLVARLMPEANKGWAMLIADFRTGGLRQIVTCDGKLVFTRQMPSLPVEASAKTVTDILQRAIGDSRGYLARFGLTESSDLRVALLPGAAHGDALQDAAAFSNLTLFSPHQAAMKIGLLPASDDADGVFAAWTAAQARLILPLMPKLIRQKQQEARVRSFGLRVAAAFCLYALAISGADVSEWMGKLSENRRVAAEIETLRAELDAKQSTQTPEAKSLDRLRTALERQRIFAEPQKQPWDAVRLLEKGLDGRARLTAMSWSDNGTLSVDLRLDKNASGNFSDRELVVRRFKTLAEALTEKMPDYSIEVARYPFPALPQEALTNAGGESRATTGEAAASLILRKKS